ncbi:MAG: hypothetical protein JWM59_715 [Verrucomicrobiales bacterium]|nr:hypothetical protein [Verrucomicrobiales bacterium]
MEDWVGGSGRSGAGAGRGRERSGELRLDLRPLAAKAGEAGAIQAVPGKRVIPCAVPCLLGGGQEFLCCALPGLQEVLEGFHILPGEHQRLADGRLMTCTNLGSDFVMPGICGFYGSGFRTRNFPPRFSQNRKLGSISYDHLKRIIFVACFLCHPPACFLCHPSPFSRSHSETFTGL